MNDTSVQDDIERPEDAEESSPLRVALGFFILPLLLVVGAVAVFLLFGLIAHEDKSAEEYLAEVTGGGINEPWQGAFGLANKLARDDSLRGNPRFARSIADAFEHPNAADPQVRRFLLLALGRVAHESSVPVVADQFDDPDPEVRINAIWALGNIGPPAAGQAAEALALRLKDEDVSVRGYAAYMLGTLENQAVVEPLQIALNDSAAPIRWNSAVALARLGNSAGLPELRRMIDRQHLTSSTELNDQQQQDAMIAAIQALGMLQARDVDAALADLIDNDPDLRVRQAARVALASINRLPLP